MRNPVVLVLLVLLLVVGTTACRRDHERRHPAEQAGAQDDAPAKEPTPGGFTEEIQLPPGLVHIQSQWVGESLWVESYDPNTKACLYREYYKGKPLEGGGKVLMKGCRMPFTMNDQPEADGQQPKASPAAPAPAAKPLARPQAKPKA